MDTHQQIDYIKRIKALSETGLLYATDGYNKERYEELLDISHQLLSLVSGEPLARLENFFMPGKDYPTPKVDIRGLVMNPSNEILFVKERADNKWALPGGWGDIGFSPSEVIQKEIQEETGLQSTVIRLLAVYDKKCHPHPPQPFYVYKLVFLCQAQGKIAPGFDVAEARYFAITDLPELSEDRILGTQIEQLYQKVVNDDKEVYFD